MSFFLIIYKVNTFRYNFDDSWCDYWYLFDIFFLYKLGIVIVFVASAVTVALIVYCVKKRKRNAVKYSSLEEELDELMNSDYSDDSEDDTLEITLEKKEETKEEPTEKEQTENV